MLTEKPDAIMINVPEGFFRDTQYREESFRRYYESMGKPGNEDGCFYHWISTIPVQDVTTVYVCFRGKVQYKAFLVEKIKNGRPRPEWEQRNWIVTTGPVEKPPVDIPQRGFRGFRYTKNLF